MRGRRLTRIVFASSVLWTEKIHRTELNWTVVWSIFRLRLPKFGVIPVAGCLISKIIQNHSKTSWNQLQPVKRSHVLHSLVTPFITFNLIFGQKWLRIEKDIIKSILEQILFLCNLYQNDFNSNSLKSSSFCFILFLDIETLSRQMCSPSVNVGYASINLQLSHYILPKSLWDVIQFQS